MKIDYYEIKLIFMKIYAEQITSDRRNLFKYVTFIRNMNENMDRRNLLKYMYVTFIRNMNETT